MMLLDTPAANEALAEMNDIVSAPVASWWPLAPGWYVVGTLVLIVLAVAIWLLLRRWRQRRMQRLALRELAQQPATNPAAVTALLKQALLAYFPREQVASMQGAVWWQFLQQQLSTRAAKRWQPVIDELERTQYSGDTAADLVVEYQRYAQFWLQRALPPTGGKS
ncbi:hypothetical protein CWE22_04540 [Pseudidiomarina aestuarii]|uniref:DUF4381 domain-containing protein n=1 Tax=Pseudidiomarina aestuarii TaxID=624146 RepID=A0A7Z6ZUC1_9GAMM|nr:DUF4381 domain-containing protein [Pseudidiomarina aestuarii]RUO41441.1 hypothetical protein CWE22_04540 [Pseudidiomarina aestuarii]